MVHIAMYNTALLKVVSAIFFLVCFFKSKQEHLSDYEKCFLFPFKSSFCTQENKILEFYIFKFTSSRK